jgi:transketolase
VTEIDGHDMAEVVTALEAARAYREGPSCIIAHTVKGKGVSFMEDEVSWHGRAPCDEEAAQALDEIRRACDLD